MERSRTWRDVQWAVLGGETLRAQESEGTWACTALGAGAAKHKCLYQQGHGSVSLSGHGQAESGLRGTWGAGERCQGKSCLRWGLGAREYQEPGGST